MNTTLGILTVWVLAAAGIQLGTLWIMKLSILPMLNSLPYRRYVDICQLIDMHAFHPIAVWNGVIAAGIGIWAAVLAPNALIGALFIAGSITMMIVGLASEGFNRPIWRQVEHWSPDREPEGWQRKRTHWHIAHQVRTYAAILAVVAFVGAFIGEVA